MIFAETVNLFEGLWRVFVFFLVAAAVVLILLIASCACAFHAGKGSKVARVLLALPSCILVAEMAYFPSIVWPWLAVFLVGLFYLGRSSNSINAPLAPAPSSVDGKWDQARPEPHNDQHDSPDPMINR
jgi:hypothetical protein